MTIVYSKIIGASCEHLRSIFAFTAKQYCATVTATDCRCDHFSVLLRAMRVVYCIISCLVASVFHFQYSKLQTDGNSKQFCIWKDAHTWIFGWLCVSLRRSARSRTKRLLCSQAAQIRRSRRRRCRRRKSKNKNYKKNLSVCSALFTEPERQIKTHAANKMLKHALCAWWRWLYRCISYRVG